ncbi:hypothetical protein JYT32_00485 [Dehalococcoides mccartyi]|nr:hypothetical protein [Dehalococcoides mccartyi]
MTNFNVRDHSRRVAIVVVAVLVSVLVAGCGGDEAQDVTPGEPASGLSANPGNSTEYSTKFHYTEDVLLEFAQVLLPQSWECNGNPKKPNMSFPYAQGAGKGAGFAETVQQMKDEGLARLTTAKELNIDLLKRSIQFEAKSSENKRDFRAQYNYVIDADNCVIYVAVWQKVVELDEPSLKCVYDSRPRVTETVKAADVLYDSNWAQAENMVNVFPELKEGDRTSPCWLVLATVDSKNSGIMDSMSKHMMLAQPVGKKSFSTLNLRELDGKKNNDGTKTDVRVAYAGEMCVSYNRAGNITEVKINSNSGTYKPAVRYLEEVAKFISKELKWEPKESQRSGHNCKNQKFPQNVEPITGS